MIKVYARENGKTQVREIVSSSDFPSGVVWVDMFAPSPEEMDMVEDHLHIELPNKSEIWKNHILNRLYTENSVAYMTAALINKIKTPYPETVAVTFILGKTFFLTMRDIDPTSFKNFSDRLQKQGSLFETPANLAEGLFEEMIVRVAHNSEQLVDTLDELSHSIFATDVFEDDKPRNTTHVMKVALKNLGNAADLNSKINESLHAISRMLVFFKQSTNAHPATDSCIDILIMDVQALITQTAFLSDKVTFQLDATLGMINVEQNLIIKIFSIVTVFFLPATLVSSIYGMNFGHMPELDWVWGYPFALALMVLCAIVPHVYFKRKGWL
ncbi:MAG: magnesium transporter CorA family protein [Alphaproteobacteria bacterium]|nr:magnesium transporter CorA family protein [Alphaproteobacteria bacterium]